MEDDTIKLLRECDAGIKMGITAIDELQSKACDKKLEDILSKSKTEHSKLQDELDVLLEKYNDEGKEANPIAKGMSWLKTNIMMTMDNNDSTIADLISDGCNMGIKSAYKYLNQYKAADSSSKSITNKLIKIEEDLQKNMREYL